jgi:ribosomal protein S15P/S13E
MNMQDYTTKEERNALLEHRKKLAAYIEEVKILRYKIRAIMERVRQRKNAAKQKNG